MRGRRDEHCKALKQRFCKIWQNERGLSFLYQIAPYRTIGRFAIRSGFERPGIMTFGPARVCRTANPFSFLVAMIAAPSRALHNAPSSKHVCAVHCSRSRTPEPLALCAQQDQARLPPYAIKCEKSLLSWPHQVILSVITNAVEDTGPTFTASAIRTERRQRRIRQPSQAR